MLYHTDMGYNSNLTKEQNKILSGKSGRRHKLWITGMVLRVIGLCIIIPATIFILFAGGWSLMILFIMLSHPIVWVGILFLAFGQYFISNWKYK